MGILEEAAEGLQPNKHKLANIERLNRSRTKGIKVSMVLKFMNVNYNRTAREIEIAVNAIKGIYNPTRTVLN